MNGVQVKCPVPITNDEMNLGVMLLHIAHANPEVVTEKRMIRCSEISFPGTVASKFAKVPNITENTSIPADDFTRIVDKLIKAELVLRMTNKRGKSKVYTFPFLPIMLIDDPTDPIVMFTSAPCCYFEDDVMNGKTVRQMKPKGELKELMLSWLKENPL